MINIKLQTVTILYYCESSLVMKHQICQFMRNKDGRVRIPASFKLGKSIIAVCEGAINVLNVIGERAMSTKHLSIAS